LSFSSLVCTVCSNPCFRVAMTTLWLRWLHDTVWLHGQTQTFDASLNIKTNSMLWFFLETFITSKMFINSPFLFKPNVHCSVHKRTLLRTILSLFDTVRIAISYWALSKVNFSVIRSSVCESPRWYPVFKNSVCIFFTLRVLRVQSISR
jgi:hypothetical protein